MTDEQQPRAPSSPTGTPLHPRTQADRATSPLFQLGQIVATPGALQMLKEFGVQPFTLLNRHVCGDWGDLDESDRHENNMALIHGNRLLSAYSLQRQDGTRVRTEKVWIITEADRSSSCMLLPSEY